MDTRVGHYFIVSLTTNRSEKTPTADDGIVDDEDDDRAHDGDEYAVEVKPRHRGGAKGGKR